MIVEPRPALDRFIAALESHFAAATSGRGEENQGFTAAYATLIDAFETYDEALYEATGIDTPFIVYDDGEDEDDYDEDDLDDDMDGDDEDEDGDGF